MRPGVALGLLAALWLSTTASIKVDQKIVDSDRVITVAEYQVRKALDSELCKSAFKGQMPGYDDDWDLLRTWDQQVQFVVVPWIAGNDLARAITNCDVSRNTFILSRNYSGWSGIKATKEAMIHEFIHLLRCEAIINDCGSQSNCAPLRRVEEERLAYNISRVCRDAF